MGSADTTRALHTADAQRRLSKEELLTPKIIERDVPIESLGGTVRLRSLSYGMRREIRKQSKWGTADQDSELFELLCIVESLVDPKLTLEDLVEFQKQDMVIIDELSIQVELINLPRTAEDLKKGSETTQTSDSP